MMARKKVERFEIAARDSLSERIREMISDARMAAVLENDRHLIEAALATEKRVSSLDEEVRRSLRAVRNELPEVKSVCWVNPSTPDENAVAWLESGAPAEAVRTLGYVPPQSKR
jgi:hypothetical protein